MSLLYYYGIHLGIIEERCIVLLEISIKCSTYDELTVRTFSKNIPFRGSPKPFKSVRLLTFL